MIPVPPSIQPPPRDALRSYKRSDGDSSRSDSFTLDRAADRSDPFQIRISQGVQTRADLKRQQMLQARDSLEDLAQLSSSTQETYEILQRMRSQAMVVAGDDTADSLRSLLGHSFRSSLALLDQHAETQEEVWESLGIKLEEDETLEELLQGRRGLSSSSLNLESVRIGEQGSALLSLERLERGMDLVLERLELIQGLEQGFMQRLGLGPGDPSSDEVQKDLDAVFEEAAELGAQIFELGDRALRAQSPYISRSLLDNIS